MPPAKSATKSPLDLAKRPEARAIRAKGGQRTRMSSQLKIAIEAMAYEGLSLPLAAERANMAISSLKRAMRQPHVKQAQNQLIMDIRNNAGQSAYLRNVRLSQVAGSEAVRADLNKWIAGVDNIAAIKRVEGRIAHTHAFAGFAFGDDDAVDVTPPDSPSGDDDD